MEVCPLSREVMLCEGCRTQPLSARLQSGIHFFHPPIPAAPSARLAVRFPSRRPHNDGAQSGRATGLPRSVWVPEWVRARLFAGGAMSASGEVEAPELCPHTILVQAFDCRWTAISILGLSSLTTFISDSHMLPLPLDPSSRPLRC